MAEFEFTSEQKRALRKFEIVCLCPELGGVNAAVGRMFDGTYSCSLFLCRSFRSIPSVERALRNYLESSKSAVLVSKY